ncbi:Tbp1 transcription initiation factor [Podospora appendiculata]|uniref:Tbp1 transcription initiation factor n=1 Tax=Podospora appendiculata TaxID=314037 RepID=A0AAE1CC79_9PEZI|nr:Tbp1 transcription initiation factor [Podospora appendiculata]
MPSPPPHIVPLTGRLARGPKTDNRKVIKSAMETRRQARVRRLLEAELLSKGGTEGLDENKTAARIFQEGQVATDTGNRTSVSGLSRIQPHWPMPTTTNVVCTANTNCLLDLNFLARNCRNVQYNKKRFHALIMRIRDPRTTALVFARGKIVVTGAKSQAMGHLAARKHMRALQKCGFNVRFKDFKVQNFVASCTLGFTVRLEGLVAAHHLFCYYEPELFPGVVFRMVNPRVVFLVFHSDGR